MQYSIIAVAETHRTRSESLSCLG